MQIVIDISEEDYKALKHGHVPFNVLDVIMNGTSLPKLEQESVLDKIRAEIEELDGKYVIGDYGIYGENVPKYVRFWDVLQIIDKYKAGSEPQESEGKE